MFSVQRTGRRFRVSVARCAGADEFPLNRALPGCRGTVPAPLLSGLSLVLLAAVLAGCGGGGSAGVSAATSASRSAGIPAQGFSAPDFSLRDQSGHLVSLRSERGRFVVITFLYVHCRNVCPIVAGQLNEALRKLGPQRTEMRVLAVSVDPKGDTPAAVRHFIAVHQLLPEFHYLTGTVRALKPIWREYHIASVETDKGLVVGHTSIELLLDRSGKPQFIFDSHITAQALIDDLHELGLKGAA